jgi:histidyl-tRNA synthetase
MKDLTHIKRFNESEENLNISDVSKLLNTLKKCRKWMINRGINIDSDFFKEIDDVINSY